MKRGAFAGADLTGVLGIFRASAAGQHLWDDFAGPRGCGDGGLHGEVVVCTVALVIVRRMLGVLGCGPSPDARTVEIAVPRHQLAVLHRQLRVRGDREAQSRPRQP